MSILDTMFVTTLMILRIFPSHQSCFILTFLVYTATFPPVAKNRFKWFSSQKLKSNKIILKL